MEENYCNIVTLKFEVNLLYAEDILTQNKIPFKSGHDSLFSLAVPASHYQEALAIIQELDLDEKDVSADSDGYIDGHEEWSKKMYVDGYFTGGVIPRWMYGVKYARFLGPINIITGIFMCYIIVSENELGFNVLWALLYLACGILLTIRGYSTAAS